MKTPLLADRAPADFTPFSGRRKRPIGLFFYSPSLSRLPCITPLSG